MKTKIGKYCFSQYFRLIIWTTPKNVSFDQKRAVMGAISQKEGIEILQDTPYIEAFWIPDQLVSSAFMEMKVTLEEGCANGRKKEWWEMRGEWRGKWMFESIFSFSLWLLECEEGGTSGSCAHSAVFFDISLAKIGHPNRSREVDGHAKLNIWTTFQQNLPMYPWGNPGKVLK